MRNHVLLDYVRSVYSGKTLSRFLFNRWLVRVAKVMTGKVLDIGAKDSGRLLLFIDPKRVTVVPTDIESAPGVEQVDLNYPLPYPVAHFDTVTLFWVLYIVRHPSVSIAEVYRVLKPGGRVYLAMPFVSSELSEPHDYTRFTGEGLEALLLEAGFEGVEVTRSGGRVMAAVNLLNPFFVFNTVRLFVYAVALGIDTFTEHRFVHKTPQAYFVIARKPHADARNVPKPP